MCFTGLPDQNGRYEILQIHTSKLRKRKKLADDVDIEHLVQSTPNFSGAELEGLVRSAESTAMNRIIAEKIEMERDSSKSGTTTSLIELFLTKPHGIKITAEDAEKLLVSEADFEHAIQHDIKPACGVSKEYFDRYIRNG